MSLTLGAISKALSNLCAIDVKKRKQQPNPTQPCLASLKNEAEEIWVKSGFKRTK